MFSLNQCFPIKQLQSSSKSITPRLSWPIHTILTTLAKAAWICQTTYLCRKYNYRCFKLSNATGNSINFSTSFFLIKYVWASSVSSRAAASQFMRVCCLRAEAHGTAGCKRRVTWGWLIAGLVGQCARRRRNDLTFADKTCEVVKIKISECKNRWAQCELLHHSWDGKQINRTGVKCLMSFCFNRATVTIFWMPH